MAATNIITQFVLKQFAKKSAKKTGISKLLKASDPIVQSNVRSIEIILKNMGIDKTKLTSTDNVLQAMNYHKAMMDQHLKQQFKGLDLGKGIKSLEKKDPFQGFTPKIVPKDKTLLKDSPEAIAKIKAENKAAAERLRKKKLDEEPDDLASGGIARVGMFVGGRAAGKLFMEFVEKLFIKASNDIRLAKGRWAGLTQEQIAIQHENLTKKVIEFQKSGKTVGLEEYFGVDPHTAFIAARDKVKRQGIIKDFPDDSVKTTKLTKSELGKITKEDIDQGFKEAKETEDFFTEGRGVYQKEADEIFKKNKGLTDDEIMQKAYDEIHGGSGFSGDYKYDADILAEQYALQKGAVYTDLPEKEISKYYNPALKRVTQNLKARMEAKKALKDIHQKIELQMFDPKDRKPNASGGIAGQLHLNRPGYQQGNEVLPPSLRGTKTEDKKIPYWAEKIMSYDKDVMPEEYKIPGSGGYGSILRHAGNTALLKKQLSEKGFGDTLGGILALGGGTLHELTAQSPIWVDEKRTVDEALPFDVGPSKKLSAEFKEDMLANLYGALYGKTGIKDKEVLDRLIERLSKQDNWSEIFSELIAEQAHEDPERPMRMMPQFIPRKVRNPRTGKIEIKNVIIDSPFSNKKLTQTEFIKKMEDKGKLATSATEGSFAKGGLAHVLGV